MDEKLKARYKEILEAYLQHSDEEELYKTSLLSKELINNRVDPDEIIAMHFEILNQVTKNLPREKMYRIYNNCLLYTSPSPRDRTRSRMPSSA